MANWIQAEAAQQAVGAGATVTIGALGGLGAADRLVGIFEADQAGNVTIEYSINGQDWDYIETIPVTAGVGVKISSEIVAPFVRVRFNNTAGSPTTYVRSQVKSSSAGPR